MEWHGRIGKRTLWIRFSKRDLDYYKSQVLEKLFSKFIQLLNSYHNTNYSERFWKILIGPWFKLIVRDLFFYISTIENCLSTNEISGTTCYDFNEAFCISDIKDTIEFLNDQKKIKYIILAYI